MQGRSGLVPADQAERLHLLEVLEPAGGRRMDHAEETAIMECVSRTDVSVSLDPGLCSSLRAVWCRPPTASLLCIDPSMYKALNLHDAV